MTLFIMDPTLFSVRNKTKNFQMTVRERVEDDEMEVSVCNGGEVPAIETQNRIIKTHMNSTLHEGDVWRLIPFKWFEVRVLGQWIAM